MLLRCPSPISVILLAGCLLTLPSLTWQAADSCSADGGDCVSGSEYVHEKRKWLSRGDVVFPAELANDVKQHYDEFPYPYIADDMLMKEEACLKSDSTEKCKPYVRDSVSLDILNHHVFKGQLDLSEPFRALMVGDGVGLSTVYLAQQLADSAGSEVVYLDFSKKSLEVAKQRAKSMRLTNIKFIHDSLENLEDIQGSIGKFHLIECRHVLEHTTNPEANLKRLVNLLEPNGVISLALHADVGRTGLQHLQELMKKLNKNATSSQERISRTRLMLSGVPETNFYVRYQKLGVVFLYEPRTTKVETSSGAQFSDAEIAELFINPIYRSYRINDIYELAASAGLKVAGYPDFADAASLKIENALTDQDLLEIMSQKDIVKQQTLAELMIGIMTKHEVYLVKNDAADGQLEADFNDWNKVPFFYGKPEGLPDFPPKIPKDGLFRGEILELRPERQDKRFRKVRWPVSEFIYHFIAIVKRDKGQSIAEIVDEILKETGVINVSKQKVFEDIRKFYTACHESGLLYLRSKGSPRLSSLNQKLFKIKED